MAKAQPHFGHRRSFSVTPLRRRILEPAIIVRPPRIAGARGQK